MTPTYLDKLREKLTKISGDWTGDESGLQEDRAGSADEAIKIIEMFERADKVEYPQGLERLLELLEYLDETE